MLVSAGKFSRKTKSQKKDKRGSRSHKPQPDESKITPDGPDVAERHSVSAGGSSAPAEQFSSPGPKKRTRTATPKTQKKAGAPRLTDTQKAHRQRLAAREAKARKAADKHDREAKITTLTSDIAELGNHRGKSSSYERNLSVLQFMLDFRLQPLLLDEPAPVDSRIWDAAARIFRITKTGLEVVSCQSILRIWDLERAVLVNDEPRTSNRDYSDVRDLGADDLSFIDEYIMGNHKNGGSVTIASIRTALARPLVPTDGGKPGRGLNTTKSVVQYALHTLLGYEWGKVNGKKIQRNEARQDIIRAYLADIADAYKLEEEGDYVIVYTDESYIHQNIAPEFSWIKEGNEVERTRSKGQRICILHAITKYGPLTYKQGEYPESVRFTGDKKRTMHQVDHSTDNKHTCEYLFVGKKNTGDYHDMMNNENFMEWVDKKLIPTFKARFPSKKMILVLDNAPYHHVIDYAPPTKKGELVDYLRQQGCTELEVEMKDGKRMNFDVHDDAFKAKSKTTSCTMDEMRPAVLRWFKKNRKHMLESKLVRKFRDMDWHVLFTPPYCPDLQPIELFWAAGKNWARYLNTDHRRSIEKCIQDLRAGWYGDGSGKKPADCDALVKHSLKKANKRVGTDDQLDGKIEDGLSARDGCELLLGVDEMGRATKLMMRSTAVIEEEVPMNDSGLRVFDLNHDDVEGDDVEEGNCVPTPAQTQLSMPHVASIESSVTGPSSSVRTGYHATSEHPYGRLPYVPAYHPMFGSQEAFNAQLSELQRQLPNVRESLRGYYLMCGMHALCPAAFAPCL